MIRGLYQHLDSHLHELEEKFKKDEIELREKVDLEIKSQMSQKLKELKYTQTDLYRGDFLYELGKLSLYRNINDSTKIDYNFNKKTELWTDICKYEGFFNNISKLNADKLLREDEYIVGISGSVSFSKEIGIKLISININLISNYLNYYDVINQYNFNNVNIGRPFDERFQLKCIRKNDMKMFDNQIDIISSTFYKLEILINVPSQHNTARSKYNLDTCYDVNSFNMIEFNQEKEMFESKTKTYNYETLPKECRDTSILPDTDDEKLACCQKCHITLKRKKQEEFTLRYNKIIPNINNTTIIDRQHHDHNIFNLFTTTGDYSVLRDSKNRDYVIFMIYEKWFNDFWADKIEDIGISVKDISMADLIEHKDTIIDNISSENKTLHERIKSLEVELIKNKKCSEYENNLSIQIKTLKCKIITMEKEYNKLKKSEEEIEVKYQNLKSKLGSLIL